MQKNGSDETGSMSNGDEFQSLAWPGRIAIGYTHFRGGRLLTVKPDGPGAITSDWFTSRQPAIERQLSRDGAILFRGFANLDAAELHAIIVAFSGEPLDYHDPSSPRTRLGSVLNRVARACGC
jgi:hypothetical protein